MTTLSRNKYMPTVLCLTLMILSSNVYGQGKRYAVIELGNLGSERGSDSRGINELGHIAGSSNISGDHLHAMMRRDGVMIDLNPDIYQFAEGLEINDLDQVVGRARFDAGSLWRAFLWEDGEMFDLGTLGGVLSQAEAINNQGQIVGSSQFDQTGLYHPFLWENGVMRSLVDPSCVSCSGNAPDINDLGQIVGRLESPEFSREAVLWDAAGVMTRLGTLGGSGRSEARGINELGQIVGSSNNHAFLWEDGVMIDLDPGILSNSFGWAINNNGIIVGTDFKGRWKGTVWDANRKKHNLNFQIAPLARWHIETAWDINDSNQIAAAGTNKIGNRRNFALLLTPVTPAFKLSQPSPGIAGQTNTITARGGSLTPGTEVHFFWGVHGGGTRIPTCAMLDAVLQIENAKSAGSAIVNANGVATLKGKIPPGAAGTYILLQAIVGPKAPGGCTQSQLVVVKFE